MKIECGGILFTSDFDSGNLDKVEYVESEEEKYCSHSETKLPPLTNYRAIRRPKVRLETSNNSPLNAKKLLKRRIAQSKLKSSSSYQLKQPVVREYNLWTKPDCGGTPFQTTFRTWFYFGLTGGPPGVTVKLNVMNLNRQGKLYFHGMKPVFKITPSRDGWKRIPGKVDYKCSTDGNFSISFCHALPAEKDSIIYFAFTYPFSYSECQAMLDSLDAKVGSSLHLPKRDSKQADSSVYYCRELLCYTSQGNRVELLTVTSYKGMTAEREKKLPDLFPEVNNPRCHVFRNKKIVFISSRVHPGETPSSFVLNGMLNYLISSKDTIANRLRNLFVFKIVPMLNPDGVFRGHYRADLHGLNLNRIYMVANFQEHPSIYAARTLLLHYHTSYSSEDTNTLPKSTKNIEFNKRKCDKVAPHPAVLSKDNLNERQKKFGVRKHSLHSCDSLAKSLDFLSTIPSRKGKELFGKGNNEIAPPKREFKIPPVSLVNEDSMSAEDMKEPEVPADHCNECKFSNYPSKKISLESDTSCNCIEASDADDSSSFAGFEAKLGEGDASQLLKDVPCLKPEESGIAYYFDLHGHASKRGCFIYGNYFPDIDKMVDCMFLPKLMSINCPYFDFSSCNFSAENMYSGSHSNIQSKEGSGRVSLYVLTGIIHSYTLECNYNTCRFTTNEKKPRRSNFDEPSQVFFSPESYQQIGESLLVSLLDASANNPKSLIPSSQFLSIQGVKEWLKQHALSLRGRCAPNYLKKSTSILGLRSPDKVSTRSMSVKKSILISASKISKLDSSSSSNANISSNTSDSDNKLTLLKRATRSRIRRRSVSLLSSPVMERPKNLVRRHTFSQDLVRKALKKTTGSKSTSA